MTGVIAANELGFKFCNTSSRFTSENCSWKSSRAAEPYRTMDTRLSPHACCRRLTSSCSLLFGFCIAPPRAVDHQLPPAPPPPLRPPPKQPKPPNPPPPPE